MTDHIESEKVEEPAESDKPEAKSFTPDLLKRPHSQPPKFKYVPPKAGKRHF